MTTPSRQTVTLWACEFDFYGVLRVDSAEFVRLPNSVRFNGPTGSGAGAAFGYRRSLPLDHGYATSRDDAVALFFARELGRAAAIRAKAEDIERRVAQAWDMENARKRKEPQ